MRVFQELEVPDARAGAAVWELLDQYQKKAVLFLASGGSALALLEGSAPHDCSNLTLSVLDERFSQTYDEGATINNFLRFKQTRFFADATERGAASINTLPREGETLEELAKRLEKALRGWKEDNPAGMIIITQGIGPDGHTAGIAPVLGNEEWHSALYETSRWIAGYDAGEKLRYPLRITTTIPFLRSQVDHSVVYVAGEDKREALARTLSPAGDIRETPARIIHEMRDVQLFTDLRV